MEKRGRGRGVLAVKNILEGDTPRIKCRGRGILHVRSPNTQPIGVQTDVESPKEISMTKGTTKDTEIVPEKDCQDSQSTNKYMIMCYSYTANESNPGGFKELSAKKGEYLEFLSCHPDNEQWWMAKNENDEIGYVPSSYVIMKEDQVLPWLERSVLEKREKERQERLQRQEQQKTSNAGQGFGLPPKEMTTASNKPYVYVSAYNRNATPDVTSEAANKYYCDVCEKSFNGPKPFKLHMASRGHREEVELRSEQD